MSGKRHAAIVGFTEWKPQRDWPITMFATEAMAQLAAETLADAGFEKDEIDGVVIGANIPEAPLFAPSTVVEYLGLHTSYNEVVDLGGASPAGMVWRAAAAIEAGACESVLVLCPHVPAPATPSAQKSRPTLIYMGGDAWGSPQSQYEIPAGLVAATPSYAMAAQRYRAVYGLDEETLAKIAVHHRDNAQANPAAIFFGKPITVQDVLASRYLADPLKLLEAVMPCFGGAAILITGAARALRTARRPAFVSGFGEFMTHKSITNMPDLLEPPLGAAADRAFRMAGVQRKDIDLACIYDSFTINVLLALEAAGFCERGQGQHFIKERDMRFSGDFPINTHGGQLGFGQPGLAGGLSHFIEATRQIQSRADGRQLPKCDRAFCTGSGGMVSEQIAIVLEGA